MQTSQVASAAFSRAGGADSAQSGTSSLSTPNPPQDFEQIMRQSVGLPPQRRAGNNGLEQVSTSAAPTRPSAGGVNRRGDAHARAGTDNPARPGGEAGADGGVNGGTSANASTTTEAGATADSCPSRAATQPAELPGMAESRMPNLPAPRSSTIDEAPTQGDKATDTNDGAAVDQKETPTDQTRRVIDAGLTMLTLPTPVEVASVKLTAGEAGQDQTSGDKTAAGQNQEVIPVSANTAGRAADSTTFRQLTNPVPTSLVPAGLTNNAIQAQPVATTPVRPSVQPARPASSGMTSAATNASPATPALNERATEAAKHTSPARGQSAVTVTDKTPIRAEATAVKATSPRSTDAPGLRALNFARFQNLAEDAAANVSPALMRRTRPQPFAGIGVAKEEPGMDKRLEQNQFADRQVQKLPAGGREFAGRDVGAGSERALTRTDELPVDQSGKTPAANEDFAGTAFVSTTAPDGTTTVGNADALNTSASSAHTAEQLLQNLTREVAQFKHFNAESMAVVLKPDANTEIFLHMVSHGGQIEIQARFDRGDFRSLNGQWAQLQQTLSQQGVKLSSLQEGFQQPPNHNHQQAGASPWGHSQTGQQDRQQPRHGAGREAQPEIVEDFLPAGTVKSPAKHPEVTRRPASRSSLEVWA